MTDADLAHLADDSAPISDGERRQAAAEILRLRSKVRALAAMANVRQRDDAQALPARLAAGADSMWGGLEAGAAGNDDGRAAYGVRACSR